MGPEMVLNELSLQNPAKDYHEARRWMDEFVGAMSAATRAGVARVLRTESDVRYAELAPGYPVVKWLNDQEVDRKARRYFLTLATKAPLLQDVIDEGVRDKTLIFDFFQGEDRADGFGVAFLLEALPLSLRSDQRWDADYVELKVRHLDDSGELVEDTIELVHASRREHVRQHGNWIAQRHRTDVQNGMDLWDRRQDLFPRLTFCQDAEVQLVNLRPRHQMLRPIVKRLLELDSYCQQWSDGPFDPGLLPSKASIESEATLSQYGQERTFRCPDDQDRLFSWHVRLTPGAWRLYFFPQESNRQIIIGYVGPHLRTVSDPT